jgi:3-dehydroquinate synthase
MSNRKPRIGITSGKAEEVTDKNYTSAIERAGGEPIMLRPGEQNPPIEELDGLVLSGGVDVEPRLYGEPIDGTEEIDYDRDALEFDLVAKARERRIPILGICRGFQLLNVAYGGKLIQDMKGHRAYEVPCESNRRSILHPIKITKPDSKLAKALATTGEVATNSRHHQAVREQELAPALVASAVSPDGYIEALETATDHWVVGVQSHPERSYEVDPRFVGLFDTFVRKARGEAGLYDGLDLVRVELGERAYNILIGEKLIGRAADFIAPVVRGRKTLLAMDENLVRPHGERLEANLRSAGFEVSTVTLPAGEETKNAEHLGTLWDALVERRYGRDCSVIALGGGVAGDLVGFAAASFLRGVDFIQIPTSLLAMVDSSVGGKTGINHPLGKNLLGAFWQPRLVLADTDVLQTLPAGERISALAEIIKYGVIYDATLFGWLEQHIAGVRDLEGGALVHAVRRSCEIKADVVTQDERESGLREILNFGHTVAHAIENAAGYGTIRHGEAVAIGMVAESLLGIGDNPNWTRAEHDRLVSLIRAAGLPTRLPDSVPLTTGVLFDAARSDKKTRAGAVRYMVPLQIGKVEACKLDDAVVEPVLLAIGATKGRS